jgi:hypothetical protein
MNAQWGRMQAKSELVETLAWLEINRDHSIKKTGHYSIPTDIGLIDIYSGWDIRLDGRKLGSMEQFKQHLALLFKQGIIS